MNDKQELEMLAYLKIIAQNTAILADQGQRQRPLSGEELGLCVESVTQVVESLVGGLELGVLPPVSEVLPSR